MKAEHNRAEEYYAALEGMVYQFAYRYDGHGRVGPSLGTGGMSALEDAFYILGWSDPQYFPGESCDILKCQKWPQAGVPIPNGDYWNVCSDHSAELRQNVDSWKLMRKKRGRGYSTAECKERLARR